MADYIQRQAAIDTIKRIGDENYSKGYPMIGIVHAIQILERLPRMHKLRVYACLRSGNRRHLVFDVLPKVRGKNEKRGEAGMTDIERRALLGDRQAQEECTKRRIVLQCPFCGRKDVLTLHLNSNIYHNYQSDCVLGGRFVPLSDWNTRPAPPVGRCGECEHWYKGHCSTGPCATEETDADFYCPNFQATKQATSDKKQAIGDDSDEGAQETAGKRLP